MQDNRLVWADSLKGWLMILVILGHAIQGVMPEACFHDHLWNLICSFHMPAFMAVSGFFACRGRRCGGGQISLLRRFRQLMVPYLAWVAVGIALSGGCSWERVGRIVLHPDTSFWFLWVLFLINVVHAACQRLARRWGKDELLPMGVACILLLGVMVGAEPRLFGYQFLAYYFVFYLLGYCVRRFPGLQVERTVPLLVMLVAWALMAWWWNMHELPAWMPRIPHVPATLVQYAYRGLTALLGVLFLLGAAPRAMNGGGRMNRLVARVGAVSLGCYTCHLTMMGHLTHGLRMMMPGMGDGGLTAAAFAVCLCLTVAVVELLGRNKVTARLLLGKV